MKNLFICALLAVQLGAAQQGHSLKPSSRALHDLMAHTELASGADTFSLQEEPGRGEKKNVSMAAIYSLLLPGMGELYVGEYGSGKYFTIAEAGLWIGWGGMQWYGSWLQNDARQFAVQHAGITTDEKDDQYYIDIGNSRSVYSYNDQVLRNGDVFKTYDPLSPYYWKWDTDASRGQYRQLRVSSDVVYNDSRFLLAAIGINHLISAINAGRLAISHNHAIDEASTIDIHADVLGTLSRPNGIVISISKKF
ncbi:MAG TPA: hypothetical protein VGR15_00970 [Bacteroidota bacterium]|nr:hypothetical protein [Bacteroidota bacterium]